MSDNTLATEPGHERGCPGPSRPSQMMDGWRFCPSCTRMIPDTLAKGGARELKGLP